MGLDDKTVKIVLDERDLPSHWYNVVPDLPTPPAPTLHPATGLRVVEPADLALPSTAAWWRVATLPGGVARDVWSSFHAAR